MFLSQLLTSQVLTCTVNGCKSNTRRYLVYLIFFVARLDNKWLVQNSSPEINTRIQKKIGPHRCLPHSQTSLQSLGWSWSSHGPDCQILQKKKNSSSVQDLDVQKTPIVDLGKMLTIPRCNFFWDRNPKAPFQPPKRSPSPQVKLFVSPFFGLLQICFSRADVQGFMTSAEKMEMPLANKYGKAGHGLHLNTAGHVLWQTDGCWWIWVVRCLGWLVVRWLGADCWENA